MCGPPRKEGEKKAALPLGGVGGRMSTRILEWGENRGSSLKGGPARERYGVVVWGGRGPRRGREGRTKRNRNCGK